MSKLTQPLTWHGGKHYLAKKIISLMPRHLHYVEPYFGGGSVLLARDPDDERLWWSDRSEERGVSEVASDLDGELMNFWDCLKNTSAFKVMTRNLEATPFSEYSYTDAMMRDEPPGSMTPADRAISFFVRARQSRQGLMKDFATLSRNRTRRGMSEQASSWLTAIEGLPDIHARLQGVVIFNRRALDVIDQQDGPKTLFYLDPPYLHETRTATKCYRYEMAFSDHACLLARIADRAFRLVGSDTHVLSRLMEAERAKVETLLRLQFRGRFILSGYRSPLYDAVAKAQGWHRHDFDLPNNASGTKTKSRKTECVWLNYEPE